MHPLDSPSFMEEDLAVDSAAMGMDSDDNYRNATYDSLLNFLLLSSMSVMFSFGGDDHLHVLMSSLQNLAIHALVTFCPDVLGNSLVILIR